MSVYTTLTPNEVEAFLANYEFRELTNLKATTAGIENTNYFLDCLDRNGQPLRLVLTLFEHLNPADLPYFVALTLFLHHKNIPVPYPYLDKNGEAIHVLKEKPTLLVPRFAGSHPHTPNPDQCKTIGNALAQIHMASSEFPERRINPKGSQWRIRESAHIIPLLNKDDGTLMANEVKKIEAALATYPNLPRGITHGDLFHDNALFNGNRLCGIIDLYNACHDYFMYDLAVVANDWCPTAVGTLDIQRYRSLIEGYTAARSPTDAEVKTWPIMLQLATFRFWLSRLIDWHNDDKAKMVEQKDPEPMKIMLLDRIANNYPLSSRH